MKLYKPPADKKKHVYNPDKEYPALLKGAEDALFPAKQQVPNPDPMPYFPILFYFLFIYFFWSCDGLCPIIDSLY